MKKLEENIESKLTNYLNNIYDDVNDFRCELSDDGCKLKIISNGGLTGHEILPEYVENIEKMPEVNARSCGALPARCAAEKASVRPRGF